MELNSGGKGRKGEGLTCNAPAVAALRVNMQIFQDLGSLGKPGGGSEGISILRDESVGRGGRPWERRLEGGQQCAEVGGLADHDGVLG
jgi:hypothetical protein